MSVLNRDEELEKKVAESVIKFINAKNLINKMLGNKFFIQDKMTEQFHDRLVASRNAINEFLEDLCEKLNCSSSELETNISKTENLFEVGNEDIVKLIDFMSKRKIVWKHVLIGVGVASIAALTIATGGTTAPLTIALTSLGLGLASTALSIIIDRMLDDLNGFVTRSRFDDIQRASNLYQQYLSYGEYPTFTKIKIYFEERFTSFFKTWKWEPTRL